jgi:malate dehydrogenase (oxaloacetate-decarboxylating)
MMPIIYTLTVGLGCRVYKQHLPAPGGLYISYPCREELDTIMANVPQHGTEVIVVTDGERIPDWVIRSEEWAFRSESSPFTRVRAFTCGRHFQFSLMLEPHRERLEDPLYLGWRHERIRGQEYDDFADAFVRAVRHRFPGVLLQWEDFSKTNAPKLLERYQNQICTFVDDIRDWSGDAAGMFAAMRLIGERLRDQRPVILGAGGIGLSGISDQIVTAMVSEGAGEEEARRTIWQIDSQGLVHNGRDNPEPSQRYARPFDIRGPTGKLTSPANIGLKMSSEMFIRRFPIALHPGGSLHRGDCS